MARRQEDPDLAALGVEDDDEALAALGVEDDPEPALESTPDASSISPEPYGPSPNPAMGTAEAVRTAVNASGLLPFGLEVPTEMGARGAVASALQGPAFDWADEMAGLQAKQRAAIANMSAPAEDQEDLDAAYAAGRDAFRSTEGGFQAENPKTALGLRVAGAMLGPNPGGASPAFSTRAAGAGAAGLVAGAGVAENPEDMAFGAAMGAPLGVAGQALGEAAGTGIGWAASLLGSGAQRVGRGLVTPTPAARRLQQRGVDLTIGQMDPKSALAQVEEAGTSVGGIGPSIKGQRDAALAGVQQAALKEALPPTLSEVPPGASLGEQLDAMATAFDDAYAVAKGYAIEPGALQGSLNALDDPTVYADDILRAKAKKWLRGQRTAIRLNEDGNVLTDDVLHLRSNVRRIARETSSPEERALLKGVETKLTDAIERAMPEDVRQALAATDMQYGKFRIISEAIGAARDQPGGFTTSQLSSAVRRNTPDRVYERGGGGPLRSLARDAAESLESKIPLTGARLLAMGPVPYAVGPLSYLANLPGTKRALLGQTAAQQALQSSDALQSLVTQGAAAGAEAGGHIGALSSRGSGPTSQGDFIDNLARTNPEALGPYAEQLQRASAEGNLALAHWHLQQTDPQYRATIEALRKEQSQ